MESRYLAQKGAFSYTMQSVTYTTAFYIYSFIMHTKYLLHLYDYKQSVTRMLKCTMYPNFTSHQ